MTICHNCYRYRFVYNWSLETISLEIRITNWIFLRLNSKPMEEFELKILVVD